MPTNIRDLPLELRNRIYDELWKHTPHLNFRYSSKYGYITAEYFRHGDMSSGLPSWLTASKQVLTEASEQFRVRGKWSVIFGSASSMRCPSILLQNGACNLAVCLTSFMERVPRHPDGTLTPSPQDCTKFAALMKDIAATRTLRELTINATAHFYLDNGNPGFDLSGLHASALKDLRPHLKKLIFDIELCCDDLNDRLKSSLITAIKSVGDEVFGDRGLLRVETRSQPDAVAPGHCHWIFTRT